MLEKDIENLIAKYPDEFFPNSNFHLIGQQVKIGRCFADIIFEDRHKRKVIIEVKRGILSRDASGQVMEYYGLLKTQSPESVIELILCANIIPSERKSFLQLSGIECKELGINLINEIADKYKYQFLDKQKIEGAKAINLKIENSKSERAWIFQANPNRYDILNAFNDESIGDTMHWLVNQRKSEINEGDFGIIWLSGKEAGIYAITKILTNPDMMTEPETERKYWTDESDKHGEKLRVRMEILMRLLHYPLMKQTIIKSQELKNLDIIRQPQGTNFQVRPEEWSKIKQLINQNKQ